VSADGPLVEDLVARGVDDWVCAAEVLDLAGRTRLQDPVERRTLALGLIAEVLFSALMEPGDVDATGFKASDLPAAEAILAREHG
jgi:hypothetical protein